MEKEEQPLEEQISELLEDGEMSRLDPQEAAARRLSPRWVIRIPAERDPIVDETIRYRQMAEEVDGRYDDVPGGAKPQDEQERG